LGFVLNIYLPCVLSSSKSDTLQWQVDLAKLWRFQGTFSRRKGRRWNGQGERELNLVERFLFHTLNYNRKLLSNGQ
jgi:hypothetical protein